MAKKPKKIELNDDANTFDGSNASEKIFGNGGDDNISGGGGKDKIDGGDGNDTLKGGSGNDRISGGAGDDVVFGGSGDDTITAGVGADTVDGGTGDDTLKLAVNFADATVNKNDDGSFVITTAAGSVSVKNVEVFQFLDKTFVAEDLPVSSDGSVTLTEKADDVTGHIINAPRGFTPGGTDQVNTLNDDDILNGTDATDDVLNFDYVNDADTSDLDIQPTINKIEIINIDVRNDGDSVLDLQDEDGSVRAINVEGVDDDGNFFTVDNIQNAAGAGTGINLSINETNAENAEVNFLFDGDAVAGAADTANLVLNDADLFEVEIDDADDASNSGIEKINLQSTGAANSIAQFAIEDAESLTITGDKDLSLGNSAEASLNGLVEAVVYSGAFNQGTFNTAAGSLTTIDASALTGNLELNLGTEVKATKDGTSGVAVDFNVKTGAGNDTIRLTAGFDSAGDKVDAGTGDNTLVVYDSVAKGSITNVQHLDIDNRPTTADPLTVDSSLFTGLKDISVRNVGVDASNTIVATSSVVVLNKLTADLAKALTIEHSTTGSNGIGANVLAANLATDTAADTVAVNVIDNVNADPRFNFTLSTGGVESVTINDLDTESNSILLGADGTYAKDTTTGTRVSDITGTITLTGGKTGQFLNLDATGNLYSVSKDGTAADGGTTVAPFIGVGKNIIDVGTAAVERFNAAKIDASTYVGDVVIRVGDAADNKGAETPNGGQTITMGAGNDTVIFDDQNDSHAGLTISDVVAGGAGNDTLVLDGNVQVTIGASEWTNVSGFETIRLAGNTGSFGNAGAFGTNSYNLKLTNEMINANGVAGVIAIVNDNDTSDDGKAAGVVGATQQGGGVTIDALALDAAHSFSYNGAENGTPFTFDRFILSDATINGKAVIDGGYSTFNSNAASGDVLEARNASEVTIGDLANVKNVSNLEFTSDKALAQTSSLTLNDSLIDALVNSSHAAKSTEIETLEVRVRGNELVDGASTTLNVDVTGIDFTKFDINFVSLDGKGDTIINVIGGSTISSFTFTGGTDEDTFNGSAGADIYTGNGGNDTFVSGVGDSKAGLTTASAIIDVVKDMNVTGNDVLDFEGAAGTAANYYDGAAAVASYELAVAAANTYLGANLTVDYFEIVVGTDVYVFAENNGDGVADQVVRFENRADGDIVFGDII